MSTIKQALAVACIQLNQHPGAPARLEAEILLAYVLGKPRAYLHTWPELPLENHILNQYQALVQRRCLGEPIAYITGQREFWGLPLNVSPATLIPRPETERLVEIALELIPAEASWRIADLGTGGGALALALGSERPRCEITGTDISAAALAIAEENRRHLNLVNVRFAAGRWFDPLKGLRFDLVVSNPPYVGCNDPHLQEGDLRFEPQQALSAGPDGLEAIREIICDAVDYLIPGGWLILEHAFDQGDSVTTLFIENGFTRVFCHRDYAERERATAGQLPAK
ncbi:MAG: peptide chain release factor N(5)-glutamine methyltransferase [Gammaproteobacteria bacterium]|nr:peptide chain release factor N(5)-glutamine methyltransferase [Gammaproteobacteria bacterium]